MSHLPLSLMNRLNKTESAVFKLCMLYFQRISFQMLYFQRISFQITWKELTSWLSACAVLLYAVMIFFMFLSRMVSGAGWGIRLYWYLVIAFSSNFLIKIKFSSDIRGMFLN